MYCYRYRFSWKFFSSTSFHDQICLSVYMFLNLCKYWSMWFSFKNACILTQWLYWAANITIFPSNSSNPSRHVYPPFVSVVSAFFHDNPHCRFRKSSVSILSPPPSIAYHSRVWIAWLVSNLLCLRRFWVDGHLFEFAEKRDGAVRFFPYVNTQCFQITSTSVNIGNISRNDWIEVKTFAAPIFFCRLHRRIYKSLEMCT